MRAVLDSNVLISALLSSQGAPARVLRSWGNGEFELLASPALLDELGRALAYPKLRERITKSEAEQVVHWLSEFASVVDDPTEPPPVRSTDPDDDYLLSLASRERSVLVTGDQRLLALADDGYPIYSPDAFLKLLASRG